MEGEGVDAVAGEDFGKGLERGEAEGVLGVEETEAVAAAEVLVEAVLGWFSAARSEAGTISEKSERMERGNFMIWVLAVLGEPGYWDSVFAIRQSFFELP